MKENDPATCLDKVTNLSSNLSRWYEKLKYVNEFISKLKSVNHLKIITLPN